MEPWERLPTSPGIRVGHVQKSGNVQKSDGGVQPDDGWLTGVTVVLPPPGTVGSVDVRGGGPATLRDRRP